MTNVLKYTLGGLFALIAYTLLFFAVKGDALTIPVCETNGPGYSQTDCIVWIDEYHEWDAPPPPTYNPTTADEASAVYLWALDTNKPMSPDTACGGAGPLAPQCTPQPTPTATPLPLPTPTPDVTPPPDRKVTFTQWLPLTFNCYYVQQYEHCGNR